MSETTTLDVSRKLRGAGIEIETREVYFQFKEGEPFYPMKLTWQAVDSIESEGEIVDDAPTIAELRAYIEGKGEWREFIENLFVEIYAGGRRSELYAIDFANTLTNADNLALAYLGWKEKKG